MPEQLLLKAYFCFVAFLFGISIGSFLNVLIYRLPLGLNPAKGRSFCPNCNTSLKGRDLIPLFSYLFLKGRCRYCSQPISIRYFIVELLTGLLYTLTVYLYDVNFVSLAHLASLSALIVIAYIDYDRRIIPNYLTLFVLIVNILRTYYLQGLSPRDILITALVPPALLLGASLLAKFFSKRGFGFGDVKLALALGAGLEFTTFSLYLGLTILSQFIILIGGILANKSPQKKLPYAPSLVATYIIYILTKGFVG